jgi:hypothetical protein
VDRQEAQAALAVLRKVVDRAHDDTALQNYGLIWIIQGVAIAIAFIGTHVMLQDSDAPPRFIALWTVVIGIGFGARLVLRRGRAGVRSFVEAQLWSIWMTCIAGVSLLAVLNHAMGLRTFFLGPVMGVLIAVAFASMGSLMGRRWYALAGVFAATAIAMARFPDWQFVILGTVWGTAQIASGWYLHRRRNRHGEGEPARLA